MLFEGPRQIVQHVVWYFSLLPSAILGRMSVISTNSASYPRELTSTCWKHTIEKWEALLVALRLYTAADQGKEEGLRSC